MILERIEICRMASSQLRHQQTTECARVASGRAEMRRP
jgi:hypothetical protein